MSQSSYNEIVVIEDAVAAQNECGGGDRGVGAKRAAGQGLKLSFDRGDRASFCMREIAVSRSTVQWILRRRRARKEAEFPSIARWIGRREGDTLVVDVTSFFGKAWFDPAGNFHSDGLNVVERYSPARSSARGPYTPPEDELSTVSPSK